MLTSDLAQKIVESVMPIIKCNVNIIDENGKIIASGDAERIGKFHEIAYRVIKDKVLNLEQQITHGDNNDVLPGVNLPIFFRERIVGVIGITGNPDDILIYAQLIQQTAELLIYKEYSSNKFEHRKLIMRDIIESILASLPIDEKLFTEMNRLKEILPNLSKCLIIKQNELNKNLNYLEPLLNILVNSIGYYKDQLYIIFVPKTCNVKLLNNFLTEKKMQAYVGNDITDFADLNQSFEVARALLYIKSDQLINYCQDYSLELPIIIHHIKNKDFYHQDVKKFKELMKNDQLYLTVQEYFNCNGVIKDICEKLFVHRNTVLYRIQRIEDLYGFDLYNIKNQYKLYCFYSIAKLTNYIL